MNTIQGVSEIMQKSEAVTVFIIMTNMGPNMKLQKKKIVAIQYRLSRYDILNIVVSLTLSKD